MLTPSIFQTTSFNPNQLPTQSVIFDANGMIDEGPITNAAALGYNAANLDAYLEQGFASIGYGSLVFDISQQFPGATYFHTINVGTSVNDNTTVLDDHGIRGTTGSDVIWDVSGNDVFKTGQGADLIVSMNGDNRVASGGGDDIVFLGDGNDIVKAGGGSDTVITRGGNDAIQAGGGHDTVDAGAGDDLVLGGGGRDRIIGGEGNDTVTGGNGRDTFVFAQGLGADLVTDFQNGKDRLEIDTGLAADFQAVQAAASVSGSDLVLTFGLDEITLAKMSIGDLDASDVIFV